MRVFKNLFGRGDKIHADEIVVGDANAYRPLSLALSKTVNLAGRDTNTPGQQSISLGFKPTFVRIRAFLSAPSCYLYESDGVYDGNSQFCIYKYGNVSDAPNYNDYMVHLHSGGAYNCAKLSVTDDGIILNWQITGVLPSGLIIMQVEAS